MTIEQRESWPAFRSCGVRIDALPLEKAARLIANREVPGAVHLCNAYTLSLASKDPELAAVLEQGNLNLPDGMPLIWIAKRLGLAHMTERVYGPDLMRRTLEIGQDQGTRHFLYGSSDHVLARLAAAIETSCPSARIVGTLAPPVSADHLVFQASVREIGAERPDVVWVGLGTPKQDHVAQLFASDLDCTVVAIGAAFDFIAGMKSQAPVWVQRAGLEWSYRLACEPRRLWKRYIFGNASFLSANLRFPPTLEDFAKQDRRDSSA